MERPVLLDDRIAFDRMATDIAGMFGDVELRLTRAAALQLRKGLENGRSAALSVRVGDLRRTAEQLASSLQSAWPDEVQRVMTTAAEYGTAAALQDLSALAGGADITASGVPGSLAAQLATADLSSSLTDVTRRILRYPQDIYQRAVGQSVVDSLFGLSTNRQAQAAAWQRMVSSGVTGFVDKAGRRWNLASYTEMATRTAARRAWEGQHLSVIQGNGVDLVSIVVGSGACQKCAQQSGKILRVNGGPIGQIEVQSAIGDGVVTVGVDGTLDEARAEGWDHPNCRCRPVAYLSGLSVVTGQTTYDPKAEAERTQLRSLERGVRQAKMDQASAMTDRQAARARQTQRDLQARIREHTSTTGLARRREREQIDLGHRLLVP